MLALQAASCRLSPFQVHDTGFTFSHLVCGTYHVPSSHACLGCHNPHMVCWYKHPTFAVAAVSRCDTAQSFFGLIMLHIRFSKNATAACQACLVHGASITGPCSSNPITVMIQMLVKVRSSYQTNQSNCTIDPSSFQPQALPSFCRVLCYRNVLSDILAHSMVHYGTHSLEHKARQRAVPKFATCKQ